MRKDVYIVYGNHNSPTAIEDYVIFLDKMARECGFQLLYSQFIVPNAANVLLECFAPDFMAHLKQIKTEFPDTSIACIFTEIVTGYTLNDFEILNLPEDERPARIEAVRLLKEQRLQRNSAPVDPPVAIVEPAAMAEPAAPEVVETVAESPIAEAVEVPPERLLVRCWKSFKFIAISILPPVVLHLLRIVLGPLRRLVRRLLSRASAAGPDEVEASVAKLSLAAEHLTKPDLDPVVEAKVEEAVAAADEIPEPDRLIGLYHNSHYWEERYEAFVQAIPLLSEVWYLIPHQREALENLVGREKVKFFPIAGLSPVPEFDSQVRSTQSVLYDFLFTGTMTPYRLEQVEKLKSRGFSVLIGPPFLPSSVRERYVSSARVCVHIRHKPDWYFPSVMRLHFLLQSEKAIVSEQAVDRCVQEDFVVSVRSEDFVDACCDMITSGQYKTAGIAKAEAYYQGSANLRQQAMNAFRQFGLGRVQLVTADKSPIEEMGGSL